MARRSLIAIIAVTVVGLAVVAAIGVSVWVQRPSVYVREELGGAGPAHALVLYHPSRDAGFSDELSLAVVAGFRDAGLAVTRATLTPDTPADIGDVAIVAVVSNTFWGAPDRPTRDWLARARLELRPSIGIIGGAGSTDSAERLLREDLVKAGAAPVTTRAAWIFRPNDEAQPDAENRGVARAQVRAFAAAAAAQLPSTGER